MTKNIETALNLTFVSDIDSAAVSSANTYTSAHYKALIEKHKGKYLANPRYRARVAKLRRRKTNKYDNYNALGWSGELHLIRSIVVANECIATHHADNLSFSPAMFHYLIMAKAYMTATESEYFFAKEIANFANQLLWRSQTICNYINLSEKLLKLGYINPLRTSRNIIRNKFVLSMKARSLFREIEQEFNKPFDIADHWRKNKAK